jgi:NADH:ubiquinone oxidoreductase subunit 5 (subunit L)/multisubunit Na+/H+ antiporter MnhA subunit
MGLLCGLLGMHAYYEALLYLIVHAFIKIFLFLVVGAVMLYCGGCQDAR